jgi:hypothetical protein
LMAAKADPGSYEIIVNIDILNTKIIWKFYIRLPSGGWSVVKHHLNMPYA